ncbi:hypothetical protein GLYMA_01G063750v4 [Glycine max]|nr:hypothetical protein GLYMA_01G063750v4 [Glycine max]KAH1161891.1 hypothetical protein GYH30_000666 [Glycine max]
MNWLAKRIMLTLWMNCCNHWLMKQSWLVTVVDENGSQQW